MPEFLSDKLEREALPLLAKVYGREVPATVVLTEGFDGPSTLKTGPGDAVVVSPPPVGVEIDDCSLFVVVESLDGGVGVERVYEHEFSLT